MKILTDEEVEELQAGMSSTHRDVREIEAAVLSKFVNVGNISIDDLPPTVPIYIIKEQ